jgi:predicted 3-demethylubiquinone-9 3-methyltransferase (glyoxalase superfamily)
MQTITPHLWFDKEAKEAAEFHTAIFKNSRIKNTATLRNTPSGTLDLLTIELLGQTQRFSFAPGNGELLVLTAFTSCDHLFG